MMTQNNIYFLNLNPRKAAEFHCDKHVRSQILVCVRMLSTAHRILDGVASQEHKYVKGSLPARWNKAKIWSLQDDREKILYKATNINHPCSVWVRADMDHYRWLHDLLYFLIGEHKYRFGDKEHKCQKLQAALLDAPGNIPIDRWQNPPLMISDDCITVDDVQSYRLYYAKYNYTAIDWTRRGKPGWYDATLQKFHNGK